MRLINCEKQAILVSQPRAKKRVLIFVVAYNAERTIRDVLGRLPSALSDFDTEILVIDDSSQDRTFEHAYDVERTGGAPFPLTVLYNPVNQGYGGNQKIGFHYAIENRFDFVALLHGDGQYAPECLPELLQPLLRGDADAVFGSRMLTPRGAIKGGMPLYKYVGNKILTFIQNRLLDSALSEFHSGYRIYAVDALRRIPFDRNTNDFHFDTEIIIQLFRSRLRIKEIPIPTYYGAEICNVNGIKYAINVVKTTILSRAQDFGIFYERKFDVQPPSEANPLYQPKFTFVSPHTLALARVQPGSQVADIGCASGYMSRALAKRKCRVTGVDLYPPGPDCDLAEFVQCDIDHSGFPLDSGAFDYILLLDIVEHLQAPDRFLDSLRASRVGSSETKLIVSTGNIGFILMRLGLSIGWFHYGPRGILDLTHSRLYTFATFRKLFEQSGYRVEEIQGVPAPFPLVFGHGILARIALALNRALIRISKTLFSYQIFMVCSPLPTLDWLLARAYETRQHKVESCLPS